MNQELKQFLDEHIQEDTDTNTISVFPLPCGVGKSEYIKYLIADAIINQYGLIIVTDVIDRLNGYMVSHQDEQLTEYINRNMNQISVLNSANVATELKILVFKPVILMTTQRYFNLSKDELINLTTAQNYKRQKIVFDERPYLFETKKITIKMLDNIAITFKEALDNTVNQGDKQWLINQYEIFNTKLQQCLKDNEQKNIDKTNFKRELFFDYPNLTISEDDARFNTLVNRYKYLLIRHNSDILKDIEALRKLINNGVITSQKINRKKSNQKYNNFFTVVVNNADKLLNIGAKVFVLDGTADISPEYQLKCVNMVDCSQFKRDLSKLTFNIVNVNTSKNRLTTKDDKTKHLINTIINYIKAQPFNINTVFTYQAIEDIFKASFTKVNHFQNIKGSNQYRDVRNICQVGLNRWSDLVYMLYASEIYSYNDVDKSLIKRIYDQETIDKIRCELILADIEQNLYRSKVRNADNKDSCTYTIICSTHEYSRIFDDYQPLVNMIKARYEPLGAKVNIIDTPNEFKLLKAEERKTKNETGIQKFSLWLKNQNKDRLFKRADVIKECNITDEQFKELKKHGLLNRYKTEKQGIYIIT